jgi:putative mRNA 3-end processing factor
VHESIVATLRLRQSYVNLNDKDLSDIKLKFLGGTGQVGRSAVALYRDGRCVILDYGVAINHEPGFPIHVPPREVDGIFLTHAHIDHSGSIPLYYVGGKPPIYGTGVTKALTEILLKDLIKLTGYYLPFEQVDLKRMLRCWVNVNYNEELDFSGMKVKFLEAGHIPGSAQIRVTVDDKHTLVYTGDINSRSSRLLNRADLDYGELDCIITEATYANADHGDRAEVEDAFVSRVREVVERGGTAVVPAFAVGRSQEILCVLKAHNFEHDVIVDGMAREVNEIMLQHPEAIRDPKLLQSAFDGVNCVNNWHDRRQAVGKPGVIVAPAGMLSGGTASFYVEQASKNERNAIFLVSFQVPGTPGRTLIEEGKLRIRGKPTKVKSEVERFDFTSHSGKSELEDMLRGVKGNPKVFTVHGDSENCERLAEWVHSELGLEAEAATAGGVYKIN